MRELDIGEVVKRSGVPASTLRYYEQLGLLHRFDGSAAPAEIFSHIRATIATLKLEETI